LRGQAFLEEARLERQPSFQNNAGNGPYSSQLNWPGGSKPIKFLSRIRVCTDRRRLSNDMKPLLVLVTNRHMIYERIMQFGF